MINDILCQSCGSNKFTRSRVKNPFEYFVFPFMTPMRCYICGLRQWKLRSITERGKAKPRDKKKSDDD